MKIPSMIPVSECKRLSAPDTESILAHYSDPESESRRYTVRDIFRSSFDSYREKYPVPLHKEKIVRTIMACGTGELGYTLSVCPECQTIRMTADKCGCRYCSSCGYLRKRRWLEARKTEEIKGIPYFHVIFTVPHELNSLIFQNQKLLLDHLFRSVNHTVLELSAEKKKMVPGTTMVLHTFGSNMLLHYHIHMLVTGGGLSLDKKSFIISKSKNFFLPVKAVAGRYRALFMQGLKDLHDSGRLEYYGDAQKYRNSYEWKELLNICYQKEWNVEIRKYFSPSSSGNEAVQSFGSYANREAIAPDRITCSGNKSDDTQVPDVDNAYDYLAEYSSRSAITDNRIRSADQHKVSFDYKDYRSGGEKKVMTITTEEFIRRFLLHILPKGVAKIRYGGFLAGCVKAKNLALIRELLNQDPPDNPTAGMKAAELVRYFFGIDFSLCPKCSTRLMNAGRRMRAGVTVKRILAFSARAS